MPRALIILLVILAILAGGLHLALSPGGRVEDDGPTVIRLYAGAASRAPVHEAIEVFQRRHAVRVEVDYGPSSMLLSRLRLAREGDLFLSDDDVTMDQAEADGLILERRHIANLIPVIQVRQGNPHDIAGVEDLLRPGSRLAIADSQLTALGRITPAMFAAHGMAMEAVREQVVYIAETAPDLALAVALGQADAAIVWTPVAMLYRDRSVLIDIPPEGNMTSPLTIGILSSSADQAAARAFVAFLAGRMGRDIFTRHHYPVVEGIE